MAKEPPFADTGRETGAQVVVSDLDRLRFDPAEEMPDHLGAAVSPRAVKQWSGAGSR